MARFLLSSFADEASPLLDEQFAASRRHGFRYIEVRGVDNRSIGEVTPAEAKELARRFEAAGMGVSAIGSPYGKIDITDPFEPHLEDMKRGLEVANILGAKQLRMFSFFMPAGENPDDYRTPVLDRLDAMLSAAAAAGVVCCHENEKDIYGDTLARTLDLLTTFQGRMEAVFDPANFLQCGQPALAAYEALEPFVRYIHIKDALADGTIVPAGEGEGQIAELLRRFANKPGDRFVTLEPHLMEFAGLGALEKNGASMLRHAYTFENNRQAFDCAAAALQKLLAGLPAEVVAGVETQSAEGDKL